MRPRLFTAALAAMLLAVMVGVVAPSAQGSSSSSGPRVIHSERNDTSPPLREMASRARAAVKTPAGEAPFVVPRYSPFAGGSFDGGDRFSQYAGRSSSAGRGGSAPEPAAAEPRAPMPAPDVSFDGIANADNMAELGIAPLPPDPNIDVGPDHIVQMVNLLIAIYDKTGAEVMAPAPISSIWGGFGGLCETDGMGDPVVLYDHLADRWFVSQFAFDVVGGEPVGPFRQCIAISETGDPTGAYHRYGFFWSDTILNDYPKFGVWPDGYYVTVNQFDSTASFAYAGAAVGAFERDAMLMGDPASLIVFEGGDLLFLFSLLPADLDGPPPSPGAPNLIGGWGDDAFGFVDDFLFVWEFRVDFQNPLDSTLGLDEDFFPNFILPTADFDADMCGFDMDCIPQPGVGSTAFLDALSLFFMHRLQYRNFGTHQTLVANHTVDFNGTDRAGVRWYELRDEGMGWEIHQQDTHSPDSTHRWLASVAMEGAGDMAVAYSASSASIFPSIRYAGRLASDPLGTLPQTETSLIDGSGSQTSTASRWGDYSSLVVDPADDCTFWYTNEYYAATSSAGWFTRIGSFKFPSCMVSDLAAFQTAVPDPVGVGDPLTYSAEVTNEGPSDATGVTLVDTLPSDVTFVSATPSQGTCDEVAGIVTCPLGALTVGSTATVDIVVEPQEVGDLTNLIEVSSDSSDNFFTNNESTEVTPVSSEQHLPEGTTTAGFTTFVLLANPSETTAASVDLTYLTPAGPVLGPQDRVVDPGKRLTVNVNTSLGTATEVATVARSFEAPVVAEVSVHTAGSLASYEVTAADVPATSWIVPEGATHSGFDTSISIANPSLTTSAVVDVSFLRPSGVTPGPQDMTILPGYRATVPVADFVPPDDVSTRVVAESGSVVVGMNIRNQPTDIGIGGSLGLTDTATTWVVPEGATHSGFATFILIANPTGAPATVNVTFLTKASGAVPGPQGLEIPAGSRTTVSVANFVPSDDVSTLVTATAGEVAVESSIQKLDATGFVIGDSIGSQGASIADASGTLWLAAEGATHSGFTTFVLIANPGATSATVSLTYLRPAGSQAGPTLTVPAGARRTVAINAPVVDGGCGCADDISTLVEATSGKVVVELAMDKVAPGGFSKQRSLSFRLLP